MSSYHPLAKIALILSLVVIMLGAYTRLTDAGLGCPDWPGCYGHMVLPSAPPALQNAQHTFPGQPIVAHKAWTEMIHRYAAGTLSILILILAAWAIQRRRRYRQQPIVTPLLLVAVLIFQAILGLWTVTLKLLPLVVTGHLLGGMAIAGLLAWLVMASRTPCFSTTPQAARALQPWLIIGLLILIVQLFLGAWTSTNYAALACGADFPTCQGSLWPPMDGYSAFNILSPVGPNYEGGRLEMTARVTIQMAHRYWALITFLYLGVVSLVFLIANSLKNLRYLGVALCILLFLQVLLGILNVTRLLPLPIAVAHNGVAVLLLITVVALLQRLYEAKSHVLA